MEVPGVRLYELLESIEIQSDVRFVYYDYEKCERYVLEESEAKNKEVRYLYVDDYELYIEVDMED